MVAGAEHARAQRNGMRVDAVRSKRRRMSTGRPATICRRQAGTLRPALRASARAVASQRTVSVSSFRWGNSASARWPSRSRIEALGLAPPREDPGGEQQTEILVAVGVADDVLGGREQPREFDQGR